MPAPSREEIAAELLRRGVSPDEIARAGQAQVAQQGRAGMIVPRQVAPDKMAERQVYVDSAKGLNDARDRLGRAYPTLSTLDRFSELNKVQGTGGLQNWGWAGDLATLWDPELKEMSGIASQLQGQARPVGSGATSDFEQRLYRQGVPSPDKLGPTNGSIINYQRGVIQEEGDRLAFQEEFLRRNGTLAGSQDAWGRYVSKNPYTTTDKSGRSIQNGGRALWRDYFGLTPQANQQRGGSAPPAPAPQARPTSGRAATPPAQSNGWSVVGVK